MPSPFPLVQVGGGSASIPGTPEDVLEDVTAPETLAGLDGSGLGKSYTFSEAAQALADALSWSAVTYDPAVSGDWTARSPAGGGTASISGGNLSLSQPASPTTGDGYRASLLRATTADVPSGHYFEVIFRIVSWSSDANALLTFHIAANPDGTSGRELRVRVTYTGAVGVGYLEDDGGWHNAATSGTVALDGTGFMRVRVYDKHAEIASGSGSGDVSTVTWTERIVCSWDQAYSGGGWGVSKAAPKPWAYWGACLTAYGPTAGASAVLDYATIRRLS